MPDPSNSWEGMGLQVPGLFKTQRDDALKAAAHRLLTGWRQIFREAYQVGKGQPRSGFESVAPPLRKAYRAYFAWMQSMVAQESGTMSEARARQLAQWRKAYDQHHARVAAVLARQGSATQAAPGTNLYEPPAPGESWPDWVRNLSPTTTFGAGMVVAVAAAYWILSRSKR